LRAASLASDECENVQNRGDTANVSRKYPMIHDRAPKKIQHLVSLKTGNEQGERRFDQY